MSEVAAPAGMSAKDSVQSVWWAPLVMGIVSICFGLLLLAHPAETSIWVAWIVGIWWFINGVINLVMMFVDHSQWGWKLVLGLLGVFAGLVVIDAMSSTPLAATVGLATVYVFVLGIQGIVFGIIQLIQAFQGAGWGMGAMGVISILFGIFLVRNPLPASFALPWVFAIFAIAGGIAAIVLAYKVKNA